MLSCNILFYELVTLCDYSTQMRDWNAKLKITLSRNYFCRVCQKAYKSWRKHHIWIRTNDVPSPILMFLEKICEPQLGSILNNLVDFSLQFRGETAKMFRLFFVFALGLFLASNFGISQEKLADQVFLCYIKRTSFYWRCLLLGLKSIPDFRIYSLINKFNKPSFCYQKTSWNLLIKWATIINLTSLDNWRNDISDVNKSLFTKLFIIV